MIRGRGSAPGKVILLGEHSVVYGHPALAGALTQQLHVELHDDAAGPRVELPGGAGAPAELVHAFAEMARTVGVEAPLLARVSSEIPLGAGLGSSAALGVALARALFATTQRTCLPRDAFALALQFESVFHGKPSGVDPMICAEGGLISFQRVQPAPASFRFDSVAAERPVPLVVALTGIARGTRHSVMPLAARKAERPALYDPLLAALGELARGGRGAIERGDLVDLGVRFDAAHGILAALGVSCAELDELCKDLRRDGALGAKLTGAGGGGAAIALAESPEHAEALRERAARRGATCFVALLQ